MLCEMYPLYKPWYETLVEKDRLRLYLHIFTDISSEGLAMLVSVHVHVHPKDTLPPSQKGVS